MMRLVLHVVLAVLVLLNLSSCATTAHDPALATARKNVLQTRKTYLQGVAAGALIGAGAGAGIGAIVGNQSQQAGAGALIGAGAGALAGAVGGFFYAQHVVNQRRLYASAGEHLEACTKIASEQKDSVRNYNRTLAQEKARVIQDQRSLEAAIADSEKVRDRLQEEIKFQEAALANARAEKVSPSQIGAQIAQINALKAEDRRLKSELERLTAIDRDRRLSGN